MRKSVLVIFMFLMISLFYSCESKNKDIEETTQTSNTQTSITQTSITQTETSETYTIEEVKTEAVTAVVTTVAATTAAVDHSAGEAVYKSSCFACHDSGVAGSPKVGDKDAWTARIAAGSDTLYESAIKGKGAMPAKGGNTSISDADVKAAVDYMAAKSM